MEQSGKQRRRDKEQELARERALVILRVRSGAMTAKQGAQALGVSRKTYYQWEERALKAMALALENRVAGRLSVSTDEENKTLRQRIRELEKKLDLAEKTCAAKEMMVVYEDFRHGDAKKNRGINKKR